MQMSEGERVAVMCVNHGEGGREDTQPANHLNQYKGCPDLPS